MLLFNEDAAVHVYKNLHNSLFSVYAYKLFIKMEQGARQVNEPI